MTDIKIVEPVRFDRDNPVDSFRDIATRMRACRKAVQSDIAGAREEIRLREFTLPEVAYFCDIKEANLRKFVNQKNDLPVGRKSGRQWYFQFEQIAGVRQWLHDREPTDLSTKPGRRQDEQTAVIAFENLKGGSNKTTQAVLFATWSVLRGYKVLLIDADPQASATALFHLQPEIDYDPEDETLYGFIRDYQPGQTQDNVERFEELITPVKHWPGLDIVPSSSFLFTANDELNNMNKPGLAYVDPLASVIQDAAADYDIVIIDCAPAADRLTTMALYASNGIVVPFPPGWMDSDSTVKFMEQMANSIEEAEGHFSTSPDIAFMKLLLTRVRPLPDHDSITRTLRNNIGDLLRHYSHHTAALDTSAEFSGEKNIEESMGSVRTFFEIERTKSSKSKSLNAAVEWIYNINEEIEEQIWKKVWQRPVSRMGGR